MLDLWLHCEQLPHEHIWDGEGLEDELVTLKRYDSMYLYLDLKTYGSTVSGIAELYMMYQLTNLTNYTVVYERYYPEDEAKYGKYSVKGTRKNGIATLNLTGLGVIKGLKATIYIDEDTEEIIQNGKNSITLYGQTIKY